MHAQRHAYHMWRSLRKAARRRAGTENDDKKVTKALVFDAGA